MPQRLARKVLLVGWDSADWRFINPLLDQGWMPTLERLVNRGVMGNLSTLRPIYSPLIWNSIATGKMPDKHGILGFIEPDPLTGGIRPTSSTSRKVKAIWNILHQQGLNSGVVAWFAGHPAEPVRGTVVSQLYQVFPPGASAHHPVADGVIHPASLRDTLALLRTHSSDMTAAALLPFIPRAAEIDQKTDRRLERLATMLAECCSVHNAATWVMEHREWDFMAVCYDSIDHFGHTFAVYHPPRLDKVPERDFEIYRDVMTGIYRFHDMMLERLLALAGPETTVLLISDHGFHSDHLRPQRPRTHPTDEARWHRPIGIFCMAGPGIRQDERIYGAGVLDVTPTVLTLFGLPVGADMDGKVLLDAFETPPPAHSIPSWEAVPGDCGMHAADLRMDPVAAKALVDQFVALGYLPPPTETAGKLARFAVDESRFNLALVYLYSRRTALAVPVLEELVAERPGNPRTIVALAVCYARLRRPGDVRKVLAPLQEAGAAGPAVRWLLSLSDLQRAKAEQALEELLRLQEANSGVVAIEVRIGSVFLAFRRWSDAETSFQRALTLDSDALAARLGMVLVRLRQKRYREAVEAALDAVGLEHANPLGHHLLGVALTQLGQFERAVLAFETALQLAPELAIARRWLLKVHSRPGGDLGQAAVQRVILYRRTPK